MDVSGEFYSWKESKSTKLEQRSQTCRELYDSELSGLCTFDV